MTETPPRPVVIGLRGPAGAGKSTIARIIAYILRDAVVAPIAAPLKDSLATAGIDKAKDSAMYRACATAYGAAARSIDPDFWVNQWKKRNLGPPDNSEAEEKGWIPLKVTPPRWLIIDDLRYPNEAPLCDHIYYICRPDNPLLPIHHESEKWNAVTPSHEDPSNIILVNNSTPEVAFHLARLIVQEALLEHATPDKMPVVSPPPSPPTEPPVYS